MIEWLIRTSLEQRAIVLLAAAAGPQSFTGVITDTMCGANHKPMNVAPDSKCVLECVKHGSKYALLVGTNVYVLSALEPLLP